MIYFDRLMEKIRNQIELAKSAYGNKVELEFSETEGLDTIRMLARKNNIPERTFIAQLIDQGYIKRVNGRLKPTDLSLRHKLMEYHGSIRFTKRGSEYFSD